MLRVNRPRSASSVRGLFAAIVTSLALVISCGEKRDPAVGSYKLDTSDSLTKIRAAVQRAKGELASKPDNPNAHQLVKELNKVEAERKSLQWIMTIKADGTWEGSSKSLAKSESASGTWKTEAKEIVLTPTVQDGQSVSGKTPMRYVLERGDLVQIVKSPDGKEQVRLRFARQ